MPFMQSWENRGDIHRGVNWPALTSSCKATAQELCSFTVLEPQRLGNQDMSVAIIGIFAVLAITNTAVTIWLSKTRVLLRPQKIAQACVVWLVPFLGAIGIAAFLSSYRERPKPGSHHIPIESDYPGINLE
jgi:hypothetical protein